MSDPLIGPDDFHFKLKEAHGSFKRMQEILATFSKACVKNCLCATNDDGMTVLHLCCEDGWSRECQFLLNQYIEHDIPLGGLLIQDTYNDETPMQLLARDDESLIELIRYTLKNFPHFLTSPIFSSALLLEMLLNLEFTNNQYYHITDIIRVSPKSLESQGYYGSSSLIHRYCKSVIGNPEYEKIQILVIEGQKLGTLPHGGLSLPDADGSTPLSKLLQPLMNADFGETSWRTIDFCVRHSGIAVVAADFLTSLPTKLMVLSTAHLHRVDFLLNRYKHLMQNLSHDTDFTILFEAYKKLCLLPFYGRQIHSYFAEVYQLCFTRYVSLPVNQITVHGGEHILYHAIACGLPWHGLQFMANSFEATPQKRKRYQLPPSLYSASIGHDLNTTYELIQRDVGLFDYAMANQV
jgi:hypothetical protein